MKLNGIHMTFSVCSLVLSVVLAAFFGIAVGHYDNCPNFDYYDEYNYRRDYVYDDKNPDDYFNRKYYYGYDYDSYRNRYRTDITTTPGPKYRTCHYLKIAGKAVYSTLLVLMITECFISIVTAVYCCRSCCKSCCKSCGCCGNSVFCGSTGYSRESGCYCNIRCNGCFTSQQPKGIAANHQVPSHQFTTNDGTAIQYYIPTKSDTPFPRSDQVRIIQLVPCYNNGQMNLSQPLSQTDCQQEHNQNGIKTPSSQITNDAPVTQVQYPPPVYKK